MFYMEQSDWPSTINIRLHNRHLATLRRVIGYRTLNQKV